MATDETIIPLHPKPRQQQASAAYATLTLRSRGKERAIDLPIDQEVLGRFALEAEFRLMSLGEMIARVLSSISQDDSFDSVLSPPVKQAT
jgi:hypothetical protein